MYVGQTFQLDESGNVIPQTSTSGAADVNIASGVVGMDPTQNAVSVGSMGSVGDMTIKAGGTAQYLFASSVPNNGFSIYNPDATNDLWISDSAVAVANGLGSIRVAANGGGYESPLGYKPFARISIVGAVTAQKITARRW
jgi:hypothetical protein